jgi:hypothetical protein
LCAFFVCKRHSVANPKNDEFSGENSIVAENKKICDGRFKAGWKLLKFEAFAKVSPQI